MKCEDVSNELMTYMDSRANPVERIKVEEHLADCAVCRTRVAEFRAIWNVMDEVPAVEPSFGFDARVRQRIAAEPRPRRWFGFLVLEPRLAFAAVLLIALTVWVAKMPTGNSVPPATVAPSQQEDFNAIKDLDVLENFDVLTKFDAMAAGSTSAAPQQDKTQPDQPTAND
jgi:anti-sigma factor RsiW